MPVSIDNTKVTFNDATTQINAASEVVLEYKTFSNTTVADFTTGFDDTLYGSYTLLLHNLAPGADNVTLYMRTSINGGSTFSSGATDYHYNHQYIWGNTQWTLLSANNGFLHVAQQMGNAANEWGYSGRIEMFPGTQTLFTWEGGHMTFAGVNWFEHGAGRRRGSGVNALRLLFNTGGVLSGSGTLIGYRK